MPGCHEFEEVARRAFTVTPYAADADGRMVASMPSTCPGREAGDAQCSLWVDHRRDRKTGPCFALAVVRCGLHHVAFTLYPPGHVPYGRIAVAPVSSCGVLVKAASSDEGTAVEASKSPLDWSNTVFGAALDAAAGQAWPRKPSGGQEHWRTQGRRLVLGAQLVGIAHEPGDDELRHREQSARDLGVPTLVLIEQARQWEQACGYRARGAAIAGVIMSMAASRALSDQLMSAGAREGLWGRPSRWDPSCSVLRRVPFS
jgi:hypothetical protein